MIEFVSKLQYKEYEVGEFLDEKPRSLEETLVLIKTYPWEEQRHLTDVQLLGPSITIVNTFNEYLKIGLYFNQKFCMYFLDAGKHLYEMPILNLEKVCKIITSFFEGTLDLRKFNKHIFSLEASKQFITQSFQYKFNYAQYYIWLLAGTFISIFSSVGCIVLIINGFLFSLLPIVFIFFRALFIIVVSVNHYRNSRFVHINISRGKDDFYIQSDNVTEMFSKRDIKCIYINSQGSRSNWDSSIHKVEFKSGRTILISGFVIPLNTFTHKFQTYSLFTHSYKHFLF